MYDLFAIYDFLHLLSLKFDNIGITSFPTALEGQKNKALRASPGAFSVGIN